MANTIVAFNVPHTEHEVVRAQVDELSHFYDRIHQHPEIQVMFIERGEGTVIAGDYVGRFQAGDVFVVGSGQPHVFRSDPSYYKVKAKNNARSISLYFSEEYFGKELWGANELAAVRELDVLSRQGLQLTGSSIKEASDRIQKIAQSDGLEKMVEFLLLLNLLSSTKQRKSLSLRSGKLLFTEEGRMNSIVEFTFRNSHRKIYLTEAARLGNLSVEAFCRYFKLHTRKTYISFLNELRVSQACQLLIRKESSVQEVCYQAGFSNVSNFNRIFKRITGKSPLAFRQQLPFGK